MNIHVYRNLAFIDNKAIKDVDGQPISINQCNSFMTNNEWTKDGDKGGIRAIEKMLNKKYEGSGSNKESYSAKEIHGNQDKITNDIDGLLSNFESNINLIIFCFCGFSAVASYGKAQ